jgi:hypothetical protein
VPAVLDDIIYKALARDRDLRYQQAEDFADALTNFLYSAGLKATTSDIAALVREARGLGTARSDGEANLADLLVEEELLAGFTLDEKAASAPSLLAEGGGEAVDTRDWGADLGLDLEPDGAPGAPAEATPSGPRAAPPSFGASEATPPGGEAKGGGLLKRLFGGGKKS